MPVSTLARDTWTGLLDLLYPPRCLVCREFGPEVVCRECHADFNALEPPLCDRCGVMISSTPSGLCRKCEQTSHYFCRARAAGRYDGSLRKAIVNLKYGGKKRLAEPLGRFVGEFLNTHPFGEPAPEVLIPIPLHPSRMRDRGFNQSALLAEVAGRHLGLHVVPDALRRTRKTRPQVELRASEREKNVVDAFAVARPEAIRGRAVLLVDDVLTTLHTADECARVAAAAGATIVHVVGVARDL